MFLLFFKLYGYKLYVEAKLSSLDECTFMNIHESRPVKPQQIKWRTLFTCIGILKWPGSLLYFFFLKRKKDCKSAS